MNYKRVLWIIPAAVCALLAGLIYQDLQEPETPDVIASETDLHQGHQGREYQRNQEPDREDLERILYIEHQLEDSVPAPLAIAFYGELIQIYHQYDRLDKAAEAGERLAGRTGEWRDWKQAGDWYHHWMQDESDENARHRYIHKSIEMYENALAAAESAGDPGAEPAGKSDFESAGDHDSAPVTEIPALRTDLAVEYFRLGQTEKSVRQLNEALRADPDFLDANYNLGVILYQTGKKEESFSYLNRSVKLAEGSAHEETVRRFLDQNEIQLK